MLLRSRSRRRGRSPVDALYGWVWVGAWRWVYGGLFYIHGIEAIFMTGVDMGSMG